MTLLTLIPLTGFILFWRRIAGTGTASAALQASSALLLVLYAGGLIGLLQPVTWALLLVGSLLASRDFVDLVRRRSTVPVPLGVLLILALAFWIVHRGGAFAYYDEYAHWGIYIKEMLATNQLWGADSNAMHLRYVPGAPLWQYLFLALGGPLEGSAFFAQFCLLLIPLLVLWEDLAWRQVPWILAIFALVALALSNFGHGFASLYVDHVLGAWFAGTLFCFLKDVGKLPPRRLLVYALPVATMVLVKDAGLFFGLAATGIMALLMLWNTGLEGRGRRLKDGFREGAGLALACLAAAFLVTASWNINRNALDIPSATISAGGIVSGIVSKQSNLDADDVAELSRRIRDVLLDQQLSKNELTARYNAYSYGLKAQFTDRFRLTTASAITIFAIWQVIVVTRLVKREHRGRWAILGAGLLVTTLFYVTALALSYRFAFDERALSLSSYLRYVHTALLPMLLLVFLPLVPAFRNENEQDIAFPQGVRFGSSAAIFTALLAALYLVETPYLKPLYTARESPPVYVQLTPLTGSLRETIGERRLWAYFPIPDSNGLMGRIISFQMTPVRTTVQVDPDLFASQPALIEDLIRDYDYLWFPIPSPVLDQRLAFYFGDDLKQRLFRVERNDGTIAVTAMDGIF